MTSSEANQIGSSSYNKSSKSNFYAPNSPLAKIKHSDPISVGSSGVVASTTIATANTQQLTSESNSLETTIASTTNSSTMSANQTEQAEKDNLCQENQANLAHNVNETSKFFDIDYASKCFEDSMSDKNAISLNFYINGFKELMKFFHSLGTIFLFVTSDLETKIGLLENYRTVEKGDCNPAYLTIQSTIEYETKENLLRDTKRQSGARTILRLHRALEFLSALMRNLSKLEDDSETAPSAREAYSSTLAKHHPWTIRTIASFAMRTLPKKRALVESVLGKDFLFNVTSTNEKMLKLANVTDILFNVVDKYYDENDIKDLP